MQDEKVVEICGTTVCTQLTTLSWGNTEQVNLCYVFNYHRKYLQRELKLNNLKTTDPA